MGRTHLIVDGSNIATEGRTAPSLAQLDEAVRSFLEQQSYDESVVIVDATFGHRIDADEVAAFEEAVLAGELTTPPAGTIGRGDAFILQVARRADADVLSNDSFQELHAEHPWLFEAGRLWGGKPVPAVGWVFVPRAPVRGVTSRKVVQAAKKAAAKKAAVKKSATGTSDAGAAPRRADDAAKAPRKAARATATAAKATAAKTAKADKPRRSTRSPEPKAPSGQGGRRQRPPVNDQLPYATFVIEHPAGSTVTGVVDRFSSHGAYVAFGKAVGYVPLKSLGDPPPRSAREILTVGEERAFTVSRFDPTTRGIDVVPIDIRPTQTSAAPAKGGEAAAASATAGSLPTDAEEAPVSPVAKRAAKKKASAKKATARKATAKKTTARKTTAKKAVARKAPARKAPARKAGAKKTTAKRAPAKKKATAKRAPAKKATAKKSAAKRAPAKKKSAAKRAPAKRAAKKR